jgi:hypothetical protein
MLVLLFEGEVWVRHLRCSELLQLLVVDGAVAIVADGLRLFDMLGQYLWLLVRPCILGLQNIMDFLHGRVVVLLEMGLDRANH